ncbi:efflux RND transporter permease subunit [Escherichia coli]|uniref:efflux RND transporter permease subunit n=1 Tax=Escherichia coli TaxID=562 RepID=UPI0039811637
MAVRMRLRPILMTSLAFILGVLPLAISNGAGSGAQNAVGIGVMGGMVSATLLAIFFVPVFFVVIRRCFKGNQKHKGTSGALVFSVKPIKINKIFFHSPLKTFYSSRSLHYFYNSHNLSLSFRKFITSGDKMAFSSLIRELTFKR